MNRRPRWKNVRRALGVRQEPGMPEPHTFWEDFRARARLRVQERPSIGRLPRGMLVWRWAAVACSALVIAAIGYTFMPSTASALSSFDEVEVIAPHGAVLILDDQDTQSTMLWIVDMSTGDEGEPTE